MIDRTALRDEIARSLDRVAERGFDPTEEVYARLFTAYPAMEALFVRDTTGAVRGHMLFEVVEAIVDLVGPRSYAHGLIAAERVNHDHLGVDRDAFLAFFAILRDTLAAELAGDWTAAMDAAWRDLLCEIETMIA